MLRNRLTILLLVFCSLIFEIRRFTDIHCTVNPLPKYTRVNTYIYKYTSSSSHKHTHALTHAHTHIYAHSHIRKHT